MAIRLRLLAPAVLATALAALLLLAGCASDTDAPPAAEPSTASSAPEPPATSTANSGAPDPAPPPVRDATGLLLIADFGSDTVTFVDPARHPGAAEVDSVRVGTAPYGIALGEDGTAWVATAEGVAVVDTARRERTALVRYRTDTGPVGTGEYRGGGMGIAIAPDGSRVYVGVNVPGEDGVLEVIDTARREVVATAPTGMRPFDVDVATDGSEVYATNHDSYDVTIVEVGSWRTGTVLVDPYDTGRDLGAWLKPHYAAVRPSDGALLVPFEGERLLVVDPGTGRVRTESMTADTHQHGATVTADGTLFVVGTGPIGTSEGEASLTIRTADGDERLVPLDGPHEDVAVSADGRTAYVTGGFTREGYWNGISVVDVASGEVTRVPAGERPLGVVVLD
ncbi:MAG TPA: YncE family protein [Nocardioides sp.]|nr:YncE family protein [Nocardioides sp.]